jgi:hypothetical protein
MVLRERARLKTARRYVRERNENGTSMPDADAESAPALND